METDDDEWHIGYTMGKSGSFVFVALITKPLVAVIRNSSMDLAEFYEVKIVPNPTAEEQMSAKHLVTQFRLIEPLAPARVEKDHRGVSHVLITTTASFDGYVTYQSAKCTKWYNSMFGYFIDVNHIVENSNEQDARFEFKSRKSPMDQSKQIFAPTRFLHYVDPQAGDADEIRTIVGLVESENEYQDAWYVWSPSRPEKSFLLHPKFFPISDPLGKWIEMTVGDRDKVIGKVRVIEDCFRTRVELDKAEIMIEMQYDGEHSHGFGMFWNDEFRWICDPHHKVENVRRGGWYRAWVVGTRIESFNGKWKISRQQNPLECISEERRRSRSPPSTRSIFENVSPARSLNGGEQKQAGGSVTASDTSSSEKSDASERLKETKRDIARIKDLFTFFTEDDSIRQAMRLLDLEQYNELMNQFSSC